MGTTQNLHPDDTSPRVRAEHHRWRQLLKTKRGVREWLDKASDTLNVLLAGMPEEVVVSVQVELGQLGSELQTMMQASLDRRDLPCDFAADVYFVVAERNRRAAQSIQGQPCDTCGHSSSEHSSAVDSWCYECRGECHFSMHV